MPAATPPPPGPLATLLAGFSADTLLRLVRAKCPAAIECPTPKPREWDVASERFTPDPQMLLLPALPVAPNSLPVPFVVFSAAVGDNLTSRRCRRAQFDFAVSARRTGYRG